MTREKIVRMMRKIAPENWKAEWDNVGLQVGRRDGTLEGLLLALDPVPDVVEEARDKNCGMIICHHPLILVPQRRIVPEDSTYKTIKLLLKYDISLYVSHTNLDVAPFGVNYVLAERLGLEDIEVLDIWDVDRLLKLVVFVPEDYVERVRLALGDAGAGAIGNYSYCTFSAPGVGTFKPEEGTNPYIGEIGQLEHVNEYRLETILTESDLPRVMKALFAAHPYEEVAYDLYPLKNRNLKIGMGRLGVLKREIEFEEFVQFAADTLKSATVKTVKPETYIVKKIAVCSGSGGSLVEKARSAGAHVLVTGEIKYHEAIRAKELGIGVVAVGHYATEFPVLEHLKCLLQNTDPELKQIFISNVKTDPYE